MITVEQYFTHPITKVMKPHSPAQRNAAATLLSKVNAMLVDELGWEWLIDQDTGTSISGARNGNGDGGFRLDDAATGKGHSSHKILYVQQPDGTWVRDPDNAKAGVDVFDPFNWIDNRLNDAMLERYDLYREHPAATQGWCHLTDRRPHSGLRTFLP